MTQAVQPTFGSQEMLRILQQAVSEALDKKQRLGQYAVVWQDGVPVVVGGPASDKPVSSVI